jgi:hypothetical protein
MRRRTLMRRSRIVLPLLLAALAAACASSFVSVPIPFREKGVADFDAYPGLFFIDFICDVPGDAGIDAGGELRRVFGEEVPFAAGKKIVRLQPEHWDTVLDLLQRYHLAADIRYEDSAFFRDVFRAHPRSLFFTGKLKLDIKKMGVVRETRDEMGNKKNAYETVQLWEMEMKVFLIDGDAGRALWQEAYTEKFEPGSQTSAQFNFNSLLARITAKMVIALQPQRKFQERTILEK